MKTFRIQVRGKVQGVWFRASTRQKAIELSLTGWVKNKVDGSVEAIASGNLEDLNAFVKWCEQGPEFARVDHLEVEEVSFQEYASFSIHR